MDQAVANPNPHPTYKSGSSANPNLPTLGQSIANPTHPAWSSAKPNLAMYQTVANPNPVYHQDSSAKPTPTNLAQAA